jgi:hypothetical protein
LLEETGGDPDTTAADLDEALRAAVIELEEEQVRFTHPLLASVCYAEASPQRRRTHARIARAVGDPEAHARHLALAAEGEDERGGAGARGGRGARRRARGAAGRLPSSGATAHRALAARDSWYGYAVALTKAQQSAPFITDTLPPGGGASEVSAPSSSGFDWGDARMGTGVMDGIGLMLLGSARLLHRRNVVAV